MPKFDQMADQVVAAMRGYVAQAVGAVNKRMDAIEATVRESLANIREPKDGKDGAPGRDGIDGKDGAPGERGERGESGLAGKDGAPGRDGTHGEKGIDGRDGRDGKDGRDGAQGKDGSNGRDALDIDILPTLDLSRSYPAGTFALRNGGIVRAFRDTEPIVGSAGVKIDNFGWRVITNGIASVTMQQSDERTAVVRCEMTDGKIEETRFVLPTVIFRGVWREGAYKQGDQVVRSGSVWTAMRDTSSEPGNGATDWVLSAKKGADGRDGKDGKQGERGPEGRAGRDLTQMAFDGTKY